MLAKLIARATLVPPFGLDPVHITSTGVVPCPPSCLFVPAGDCDAAPSCGPEPSSRAGAVLAAGLALAPHGSLAAQATPLATPQPPGPPIPPEITDYARDWPAPGQNLAAHRAAIDSPISTATVDQLQVAWRFPLTAN